MEKLKLVSIVAICLFFTGAPLQAATLDGAALFKEHCATCHGAEGQNPRGNASNGIRMYSADEVRQRLKGYADGSYGGDKKAVMQNVVKNLQPDQVQAVSDFIGSLKK